ncbi:bacteriorhodopsin [Rubrivirga marina]|uniref:Rhodopsin n=1 Tax=Rubrivirga marina TaxID=1196024 RepID=A0A271IYE2_9BACT|nr:bacteriorhodopsin [Rubrivirga marina]PAP76276.1 rhodopsin [Rubrivirga marina]
MTFTWYWIGVASMAAGSAYFGLAAARATERRWQVLWSLYFFICLIAFALYLVMATDYGAYLAEGGHNTVWIRYVTWFLSTPLLLLALTYLGRSTSTLTGGLLGANAFMIATGFVATVLTEDTPAALHLVWWTISTGAYLAIAWAFLGRYKREAKAALPASASVFDRLVLVHLVLWTAYPVVWLLSPEGLAVFGGPVEAMLYAILDIAAKVGFGFLAANTLRTIEQNGEAGTFAPSRTATA